MFLHFDFQMGEKGARYLIIHAIMQNVEDAMLIQVGEVKYWLSVTMVNGKVLLFGNNVITYFT